MESATISTAKAAEMLGTNSEVITGWIKAGHIEALQGEKGYRVQQKPFESLVEEMRAWLSEEAEADEEGYVRASVRDIEHFWKSRKT